MLKKVQNVPTLQGDIMEAIASTGQQTENGLCKHLEERSLGSFKGERAGGIKVELEISVCSRCKRRSETGRDQALAYKGLLHFSAPGRSYAIDRRFASIHNMKIWMLNWGKGPAQFLDFNDFNERELINLQVFQRVIGEIVDEIESSLENGFNVS